MMKVCHMTSVHGPEDERIFFKECVSLARNGYEVYQVSQGGSYEKNGVHVVGVGEPPAGRLKRMTAFTKKVYQAALALDADIYHFHDPELLPYGLKLKKRGKKVIFDSHEDVPGTIYEKAWLPAPLRKITARVYTRIEKSICRRLDAVISATPHVEARFLAINARSILVTNFPILVPYTRPSASQSKTLVFFGGISRQWNHHTIIQALEKLPGCQYLLYGGGTDGYFQELRALPAWRQVQYGGKVPHEKVFDIMVNGSIGMSLLSYIPNSDWKNGNMSNTKIFEEMMMGLPVVCTDFVLWKEFVERWHCGICVNPSDPDAVAAAVQYLLDHPEEARQMGENGRRAVKGEFNWGVEEKNLLALYEEILNK